MSVRIPVAKGVLWASAFLILAVTFATTCPPAGAQSGVQLVPVTTALPAPTGIDYLVSTNQLLVSIEYPTGLPHNFEVVNADGTHSQYSPVAGIPDEVKLATVRESSGGFHVGDTFYTDPATNQIYVLPGGAPTPTLFSTLPDPLPAGVAIYIYKDTNGVFGGDLIAAVSNGRVYRINSAGVATLLAVITPDPSRIHHEGAVLEGATVVPNDPARYGPIAGTALLGAEAEGGFYAVTPSGGVTFVSFPGVTYPEDVRVIPACQNFYGVGFQSDTIWGAPASEFNSLVGDILVAEELPGNLWDVRWNAQTGSFQSTKLASVPQFEQITFSPAGLGPIQPVSIVSCTVANMMLWPPNHDLVNVGLNISTCPIPGLLTTVTVYSNEPDVPAHTGDDHFSPDAKGFTSGALRLRSERLGNGGGRVYLIVVSATAPGFPPATAFCTVVVPHSQSASSIKSIENLAALAEGSATAAGSPYTPYQVGIGPTIGPKQ